MWVRSMGQEDPLENEMSTHSSIIACRIPWAEEPGKLQSIESQKSDTNEATSHTHTHKRERFGNTGKRFLSYSVFSQKCGGPGDQFTAGCSTKV